jgi:hypothetical protein
VLTSEHRSTRIPSPFAALATGQPIHRTRPGLAVVQVRRSASSTTRNLSPFDAVTHRQAINVEAFRALQVSALS